MRINKFIAALGVTLLVLAFATPAFAGWGNSTYTNWSDVSGLPGQGSSPHGGYATNTVKCSVCHAVHNANATGELLLRTTATDACTYCHISPGISTLIVYEGDPANYAVVGLGSDKANAHNSIDNGGVEAGLVCSKCHTVHAATAQMTLNPWLSEKLLTGEQTFNILDPKWDPIAQEPLLTDNKVTALTKYCAGCHYTLAGSYNYYSSSYNEGSHVMGAANASYANPAATYSGKVAWNESTYCSSCHASQFGTGKWPHYTTGARFLVTAASSSVASSPATTPKQDGVCLRCHRDGLGAGIGLTY